MMFKRYLVVTFAIVITLCGLNLTASASNTVIGEYSGIPEARLGANITVPAYESNYIYKAPDDEFYKPKVTANSQIPLITQEEGVSFLPVFDRNTSSVTVSIYLDGKLLSQSSLDTAAAFPFEADTYRIEVLANFSDPNYLGAVSYRYDLRVINPQIFSIRGGDSYPGEVVLLHARGIASGSQITTTSNINFKPVFFPDGKGGQVALFPISYFTSPGEYFIQMSANGVTQRFDITAAEKTFQIQNMTVSQSTAQETILSNDANSEFNNTFLPLRWESDSVRHWNGQFVLPVRDPYRITTEFGAIRRVNNDPNTTRHSAIDMAAPAGTPIYASGAGRVLYAGYLKLTGYSVMIEHGYGLKTLYYHMNSLSTETGDMVAAGQEIGKMGSTGFSTGPHLHFGMTVYNVYINPFTVINTDLLVMD